MNNEKNSHGAKDPKGKYLLLLSLGALGVVFGDIGTSPLYAVREAFGHAYGLAPTTENVYGIMSLVFWSLIIVISIKYLLFVMRADNHGEGGIMALTALVTPKELKRGSARWLIILLGIFGAALLYGDSMITPAISVLAAIEGLKEITPALEQYIIPITVAILIVLFGFQSKGTAKVGALFGPITLVWFITLGILGIYQIVQHPEVILAALNPLQAVSFFARNAMPGFLVLGSIFLVVTGGEALYADMGHFGIKPIRLTWIAIVLPSLLLNYFGQGALIIADPHAAENPFFQMAPSWALIPLVILATMATVIASQAVISGAFSLTKQAVQLGYLPRIRMTQTSDKEQGQIYIPAMNWLIMIASIGLVIGFRSSSSLANAYGVGVTTDMVFTTILFAVVAKTVWKWNWFSTLGLSSVFMILDLGFWGANLPKIPHGGWFPLVVGLVFFSFMTTWKRGRQLLAQAIKKGKLPPEKFLESIKANPPTRVPGTAIFMTISPESIPPALLNNLKHNHVLHEQVVLLTVRTQDVPRVLEAQRRTVNDMGNGFYQVILNYGFMESPRVPEALAKLIKINLSEKATYFFGRETVLSTPEKGMGPWREQLFIFMHRNAQSAPAFFGIPSDRVIEVGTQVEI